MQIVPIAEQSNATNICVLSPLEISSRSKRLSACLGRCRTGARMPPVGEITENTDEDSRSNRRPIELINSRPASDPRSQTAERMSSRCDVVASWSTLHLAKRLVCCADQLNPPSKAEVGPPEQHVCSTPDFVAKVENRTTLKISRKLNFRPLCCCIAFQRHYGGP